MTDKSWVSSNVSAMSPPSHLQTHLPPPSIGAGGPQGLALCSLLTIHTHVRSFCPFTNDSHLSISNLYSSSQRTFPFRQLKTTRAQCDPSRTQGPHTPPIWSSSLVPCLREIIFSIAESRGLPWWLHFQITISLVTESLVFPKSPHFSLTPSHPIPSLGDHSSSLDDGRSLLPGCPHVLSSSSHFILHKQPDTTVLMLIHPLLKSCPRLPTVFRA